MIASNSPQLAQDELNAASDALDAAMLKNAEDYHASDYNRQDGEARQAEKRSWQVGDLISIGRFPERRLILSVYQSIILVIAESGWWNMYEVDSTSPVQIHFIGSTELEYNYQGREQAYRDYCAGRFTQHFQAH